MKQLLLLFCLFFCVPAADAQVYVKKRPPRPQSTYIPAAPGPGYTWIPGYWLYSNRHQQYIWVNGYWVKKQKGKIWVEGHWIEGPMGHKWIPGHWTNSLPPNRQTPLPQYKQPSGKKH